MVGTDPWILLEFDINILLKIFANFLYFFFILFLYFYYIYENINTHTHQKGILKWSLIPDGIRLLRVDKAPWSTHTLPAMVGTEMCVQCFAQGKYSDEVFFWKDWFTSFNTSSTSLQCPRSKSPQLSVVHTVRNCHSLTQTDTKSYGTSSATY